MIQYDLVIIGGGPAGMAAAYTAQKNGIKDILLIERRKELGGILNQCIHNGFGIHHYKQDLTGTEYAEKFAQELKNKDIKYLFNTTVLEINHEKVISAINPHEGLFKVKTKAIVLAMGCKEKSINHLMIPGDRPSGIFTAGSAQEIMNRKGAVVGTNAVILGSGNIGLIMARRLKLNGIEVKAVLEILPEPGGLQRNIEQCLNDFSIPLYTNTTIARIVGKTRLKKIVTVKVDKNKKPIKDTEREIACDTLISAVGLTPEIDSIEKSGIIFSEKGEIRADKNLECNIDGIFACGNVLKVHDLVDDVTIEGFRAGEAAAYYILGKTGNLLTTTFVANNQLQKNRPNYKNKKGERIITCILCPKSCMMIGDMDEKEIKVYGNGCEKGYSFFISELNEKNRVLTAVVKIDSKHENVIPVKSERPIPIKFLLPLARELKNFTLKPPIQIGEIVLKDIFSKGINIIAAKSITE